VDKKIIQIFKNDLQSDKGSDLDIESLNSSRKKARTNYKPYYQRKYVWQNDKASSLLESILLGYHIPPIILFSRKANDREEFDIIDGRQRYETIINYMNDDFPLSKNGLQAYKNLDKKRFNELDIDMQDRLSNSNITLIKYNLSNNIEKEYEDYIIKEIFRRYNSGITKMKIIDNERAEYIEDILNSIFEKYVQNNKKDYIQKYSKLLFPFNKQNSLELKYRDSIEELKRFFRKLYVIHLCPIKKYLSTPKLLKNIFNSLDTDNICEKELIEIIDNFDYKIKIIFKVLEPLFKKEYFFKINRELTLVFYWLLSILEVEKININLIIKYKNLIISKLESNNNYLKFQTGDMEYMYKPYKFDFFIEILTEIFKNEKKILQNNLSEIYISNKNNTKDELEEPKDELEEPIRVHKKEVIIETFIKNIKRGKYLIRPPYQRNEVINITKSSGIIESLLLDIKLPPIFVYERRDGISEIIDGQQRLLSILGFLSEKYSNEIGEKEETKKSNFKLIGLQILSELNGKKQNDLTDEQINIIYDSSLTVIKISEIDNPGFDPINLFLRLNLKPYPIDENSFEMWNSYLDKEITDFIKVDSNNSYFSDISKWAYFKKNDKRMENEEIYTILAYIDYQYTNKKIELFDILDIHSKNNKIIVRPQYNLNKQYVTRVLKDLINYNKKEKDKFIQSLKNIKKLFDKIQMLLIVLDDNKNNLSKTLDKVSINKGLVRKKYTFYLFYVLLSQIQESMILKCRNKEMLNELINFFKFINDDNILINENEFKKEVEKFVNKYKVSKRRKRLTKIEIISLKNKQNDICVLCKNKILINDKVHIDHIIPISKGGLDTIENMQIVHSSCNLSKGNKE